MSENRFMRKDYNIMNINGKIGDILKTKRLSKGLDRDTAAKMIGISKQMLGHIETNYSNPTFQTLVKMSEVYECSIGELCGEDKVNKPIDETNYIDTVIDMLKKDGTIKNDIQSFDDLDPASRQMLLAALNKYLLSSINKDSSQA